MSLKSFATSSSKRDVAETTDKRRRRSATDNGKPSTYPSSALPRIAARVSTQSERRIRELALHEDKTVQELIVRGLSRMFVERGLPPLEEAAGDVDAATSKAKKKRA
jgi:hypothetical protein